VDPDRPKRKSTTYTFTYILKYLMIKQKHLLLSSLIIDNKTKKRLHERKRKKKQ